MRMDWAESNRRDYPAAGSGAEGHPYNARRAGSGACNNASDSHFEVTSSCDDALCRARCSIQWVGALPTIKYYIGRSGLPLDTAAPLARNAHFSIQQCPIPEVFLHCIVNLTGYFLSVPRSGNSWGCTDLFKSIPPALDTFGCSHAVSPRPLPATTRCPGAC